MHIAAIQAATQRIRSHILTTPVEYSPWLSRLCGGEVWLKLEHLQITGSFKLRGAANKLLSLTAADRQRGVITASTGNHAAAVAYMATRLGISATIYLPETVSPTKVAPLAIYPVELRYHGQDAIEGETEARRVALAEGRPYLSPYNDADIIAGQGSIGPELLRQVPGLDAVLVPVGGGGLIGGIASYLNARGPDVEVIGCQPSHSAVMYESVQAGRILDLPSQPTLSDGTAGGLEGDSLTFPLCQRLVDDWVLLQETEIYDALRWLLETHHFLVEGAAALSVAALRQQPARFQGRKVVLILCGRKLGLPMLHRLSADPATL
jgi:threonine dehydratase